jgi:hypothetical protein
MEPYVGYSLSYHSFNYNTELGLSSHIFSDFKVRSKLSYGRTKAEALVTSVQPVRSLQTFWKLHSILLVHY